MKRSLTVSIDEELYERLVDVAVRKYGRIRGALSQAVSEAIKMWLEAEERRAKYAGNTCSTRLDGPLRGG